MTTKICAVFVGLLVACASKPAPTPTPATTAPFTIVELKILNGNEPGFALHADGRIEVNRSKHKGDAPAWMPVGKMTADGNLAKPDGTELGALQADGTFKLVTGQQVPFKFDGDVLVVGDKRISIDAKGMIQGGEPGFDLHVEGATDAGSRRAALLLLALLTSSESDVK
jgi:hypothetical protein